MLRRTFLGAAAAAGVSRAASGWTWGPYRGANTRPTATEEDVKHFASLGGNLLRVNGNTRPLMSKEPPYDIIEENFRLLDNVIHAAEKYGVGVVIDPHTTPGTEVSTTTRPTDKLWTEFYWHDHLVRLWDKIARRYKDRGDVIAGYDLLNEPSVPNGGRRATPADWNLLAWKLVQTIRTIDTRHPIIIEPPTIRTPEGKHINRLTAISTLRLAKDPRLVISPHMYEPHEFTHQGIQGRPEPVPYPGEIRGRRWDRKALEDVLQPVVDFQQKTGLPIFLGEFSAPRWRGADANRYVRDVIEICEQHGWSWAYHSYREADGWDAEMDNEDRTKRVRLPSTPRLELLKEFYRRNRRA